VIRFIVRYSITPSGKHRTEASVDYPSPITSTMQDDFQLTITGILRHAGRLDGRIAD
jgi:hypothetical protein